MRCAPDWTRPRRNSVVARASLTSITDVWGKYRLKKLTFAPILRVGLGLGEPDDLARNPIGSRPSGETTWQAELVTALAARFRQVLCHKQIDQRIGPV